MYQWIYGSISKWTKPLCPRSPTSESWALTQMQFRWAVQKSSREPYPRWPRSRESASTASHLPAPLLALHLPEGATPEPARSWAAPPGRCGNFSWICRSRGVWGGASTELLPRTRVRAVPAWDTPWALTWGQEDSGWWMGWEKGSEVTCCLRKKAWVGPNLPPTELLESSGKPTPLRVSRH